MIILASNSPRRRELLAHITRDFTVQGTDVDESLPAGIAPAAAVEQLSLRKALPLNNGAQIVIGADTVVAVDGTILGKPADEAEARQMLARLSGRWHSVFTGVSLVQGERHLTFSCETRVRFFDLTPTLPPANAWTRPAPTVYRAMAAYWCKKFRAITSMWWACL